MPKSQLFQPPTNPQEQLLVQDIIPLFLEDTPPQMEALGQAITQEDWSQAHNISHEIKGSARFIHAHALGTLCQTLEDATLIPDPATCHQLWTQIQQTYQQTIALIQDWKPDS